MKTRGSASCTLGTPIKISGKPDEEGIFARWEWDGEQLVARNDRYGFYQIFYFQLPGEICISSSIFKLIEEGAPTDLDYRGLSVFFRLGNFIGEDTPFEHIRVFPPSASITWSRNGFDLSSDGMPPARAARISFDGAVDGFIEYFRKAIEHQCPPSESFAVPLSGGRDSRHIAMELCRTGYKPKFCITSKYFPPLKTKDSDVAARIANVLDVSHVVVEPLGSEFEATIKKNFITNLCAPEHAWMLTMADRLAEEVETVYDGIGGDTIGALEDELQVEEQWYEMFTTGQFDELADMILIKNGLRKLFVPEEYSKMGRGIAIEHLSSELEKHADYPDPSNSYWFWTRTRRMVALAPYCVLGSVTNVLSPYLDHDLYDFLSTIPRELKFRTDLHGVTVKRAYPEYADIPFVNREESNFPDYGTTWQLIGDFTKFFITNRPKKRLRYRYVVPRLLANIFTEKYASVQRGFIPLVTYLYQLEEAASRKIGNLEWDMQISAPEKPHDPPAVLASPEITEQIENPREITLLERLAHYIAAISGIPFTDLSPFPLDEGRVGEVVVEHQLLFIEFDIPLDIQEYRRSSVSVDFREPEYILRNAVLIDENIHDETDIGRGAFPLHIGIGYIENEIAESVRYQSVIVPLDPLPDMGMMNENDFRPRVNHRACVSHESGIRVLVEFKARVKRANNDIHIVSVMSDSRDDPLRFVDRYAGLALSRVISFPVRGVYEIGTGDDTDAHIIFAYHAHHIRLGGVGASTGDHEAPRVQLLHRVEKCFRSRVRYMVIGDCRDVELLSHPVEEGGGGYHAGKRARDLRIGNGIAFEIEEAEMRLPEGIVHSRQRIEVGMRREARADSAAEIQISHGPEANRFGAAFSVDYMVQPHNLSLH